MPIKTTLEMRAPRSFWAVWISASISPAVRFLEKPLLPVAQKVQPIRQPTCVEMQIE